MVFCSLRPISTATICIVSQPKSQTHNGEQICSINSYFLLLNINSMINGTNEDLLLLPLLLLLVCSSLAMVKKQNVNFNVCRSEFRLLLCKNWGTLKPNRNILFIDYYYFAAALRVSFVFHRKCVLLPSDFCRQNTNDKYIFWLKFCYFVGIESHCHIS